MSRDLIIRTCQPPVTRLRGPVALSMRWREDRSLEIEMIFRHEGGQRVRWLVARDLLLAGLTARAGIGDVTITPREGALHVTLMARSAESETVAIDAPPVARFLERTTWVTPYGSELMDLDGLILDLLA